MLKGIAYGPDGRQLLMLGITRENLQRLEAGNPIVVDQRDMRQELGEKVPDQDVIIFFGETHTDLTRQLREVGMGAPDLGEPEPGQKLVHRAKKP